MISSELIVSLLLILTVAWILGIFFSRFGLPVMLGQLLAGVILGPPLLGIVRPSLSIELLAELGIFFAMFHTGMEMDPKELLEHIWPSLTVALGGFILPFVLGYFAARVFGGTFFQAMFVGMGVSITAIAVQAVILHSMRINQSELGHIIIGAAIADDLLALIALSTLFGLAKTGTIQIMQVSIVLIKVISFFGVTILIGHFIMPRLTRRLTHEGGKGIMFAMSSALLMAYLAELAGLHLIIGAFLAGQFVRKEIMAQEVYESIINPFYAISYGFLMPVFFVSLSFHLHLAWNWSFITFAAVLILVAIIGKGITFEFCMPLNKLRSGYIRVGLGRIGLCLQLANPGELLADAQREFLLPGGRLDRLGIGLHRNEYFPFDPFGHALPRFQR